MGCRHSKNEIQVPGHYIIVKKENGIKKEQYATVNNQDGDYYSYSYGIINCHEGNTHKKNIRRLTPQEDAIRKSGRTYELPQQFYQS